MTDKTERLAIDRLVTFTDAVVAIAITLVVLPLVDVAESARTPAEFFAHSGYALIAAGISFVVIGTFWRDHHVLFLRATGYPPLLLRSSLLWLACIVFLPVATVIEVRSPSGNRSAYALYLGTVLLAMVCHRIDELLLARGGFLPGEGGRDPKRSELVIGWVPVFVMVVVIALTLALGGHVGLWSLVLLFVSPPVRAWLSVRAERRSTT